MLKSLLTPYMLTITTWSESPVKKDTMVTYTDLQYKQDFSLNSAREGTKEHVKCLIAVEVLLHLAHAV